jgi:hypothetical protein
MAEDKVTPVARSDTLITEKVLAARIEIPPEESLAKTVEQSPVVEKREKFEPEEGLAKEVTRYIGRERRQKLDRQIETLYDRVAAELNNNPEDVIFALNKLKKAQGIVLEDMRQYEEALYWVAEIKKMLVTQHNFRRWSYSWGLFVFFYALIWLLILMAGFFVDITAFMAGGTGAWFSTLGGGMGGCVTILYNLSWHISVKQAFDRQYVMHYLVQPLMGCILGAVIFFMTNAAISLIKTPPADTLSGIIAFQILLGFIAGFRQQVVYDLVDRIVRRLSPSKVTPTEKQ